MIIYEKVGNVVVIHDVPHAPTIIDYESCLWIIENIKNQKDAYDTEEAHQMHLEKYANALPYFFIDKEKILSSRKDE